jgi:hypothetical protein
LIDGLNLDKQLNERTTAAFNNPDWLKTNNADKKNELSKIFEWYKKDLAADGKTELEWLKQYRKEKLSYLRSGILSIQLGAKRKVKKSLRTKRCFFFPFC